MAGAISKAVTSNSLTIKFELKTRILSYQTGIFWDCLVTFIFHTCELETEKKHCNKNLGENGKILGLVCEIMREEVGCRDASVKNKQ